MKTKSDFTEILQVYQNFKFKTPEMPFLYWSDNIEGTTFFKGLKGKCLVMNMEKSRFQRVNCFDNYSFICRRRKKVPKKREMNKALYIILPLIVSCPICMFTLYFWLSKEFCFRRVEIKKKKGEQRSIQTDTDQFNTEADLKTSTYSHNIKDPFR